MPRVRPQPKRPKATPIVTFLSDFGLSDSYVSEMKAAVLRQRRDVVLVDISHIVPRHDVLCGSITLERAIASFPAGTVHVAVVDPGVGTDRRLLLTQIHRQIVLCPDNGLITWGHRCHGGEFRELTWRPATSSNTFHGRDVLAPASAMLIDGKSVKSISRPINDPVLLPVAPMEEGARQGTIIQIDHFGNATTNIPAELLMAGRAKSIRVGQCDLGPLRSTYGDVPPGTALALIGSHGLLEIAVRDGSAAKKLKLRVGDSVWLGSK